jgi:fluoride ion exporter CrcB/FEX
MTVHHSAHRPSRAGLGLLGLLSLGDLATMALTDGQHPPYAVAAVDAVLGLVSLVLITRAWQRPPGSMRALIALRMLSALTTLPAFVLEGVPMAAKGAAAAIVLLTAIGVILLARQPTLELAR